MAICIESTVSVFIASCASIAEPQVHGSTMEPVPKSMHFNAVHVGSVVSSGQLYFLRNEERRVELNWLSVNSYKNVSSNKMKGRPTIES